MEQPSVATRRMAMEPTTKLTISRVAAMPDTTIQVTPMQDTSMPRTIKRHTTTPRILVRRRLSGAL